ncbi:hypothetical protein FAUST_3468 [Fusarium austroamericanum]|uniref:Uncharacterized protein n=1 Tax=Fusarium austroamericanum TaxID=282268 RepID=A0AAN6C510_FUSAU|nr:hypothetical protein FAUST_3468 [Fusarium austroamericanum]
MRLHDSQLGDAYQDDEKDRVRKGLGDLNWQNQKGQYLDYVKSLSRRWTQLELLYDFMDVGTIPTRWCIFPGEETDKNEEPRYTYGPTLREKRDQQRDRGNKMDFALLKFKETGYPEKDGSKDLKDAILGIKNANSEVKFSLFVVEDLSREVIEALGSAFAIDPRFFRAHITDYVWNNIRDRWREPSILQVDAHRQKWFQLRLIRSRYFEDQSGLKKAKEEVNQFNVMRRLDADRNQIFWDKDLDPTLWERVNGQCEKNNKQKKRVDAKVGHMRSRATFWLNEQSTIGTYGDVKFRVYINKFRSTGVLLLEPTPKSGFPLWRGYPNWDDMPPFDDKAVYLSPQENDPQIPPSLRNPPGSWFEEYLFWAQRTGKFDNSHGGRGDEQSFIPAQCLLHLVCGEWLTFVDYLNARLNQIDWGISNPSFFPESGGTDHQKQSLGKLYFWRRWVPQARDMLQDTMGQVIDGKDTVRQVSDCRVDIVAQVFKSYEKDLRFIRKRLEDYEVRIDSLTTVVNSTISLADASNTSKLTILASFFIPPSLVAALLSMNVDPLIGLADALKWWTVASVLAVVTLFAAGYFVKTKKAERLKRVLSFSQLVSKLDRRSSGNPSLV